MKAGEEKRLENGQEVMQKDHKAQFITWVSDHEKFSSRPDPRNAVPPTKEASQLSMVGIYYS